MLERKKIKKLIIFSNLIIIYLSYLSIYIFSKNINFFNFFIFFSIISFSMYIFFRYLNKKNILKHKKVFSIEQDIKIFMKACIDQVVFIIITLFLLKNFFLEPLLLMLGFFLTLSLAIINIYFIRIYQKKMRRNGLDVDLIVMIGENSFTEYIKGKIEVDPAYGFKFKKIFTAAEFKTNPEKIFEYLLENKISEIIITNPKDIIETVKLYKNKFRENDIKCYLIPDCYDLITNVSQKIYIANQPFFRIYDNSISGIKFYVKRIFDFFLSLFLLIVLAPVFVMLYLFIKLDSPGPVIYSQIRCGKNGRKFKFYKFRSMKVNADRELDKLKGFNEATGPIFKMKNDPRVTTFGAFIRKFSLDELPQLYNVLKGDMSLIGPRPPIPEEVEEYEEWHKRRLSVIPGITGLWQVRGRSELTFNEMVQLDIYYIENWTFGFDLYILLKTVGVVFNARGAY